MAPDNREKIHYFDSLAPRWDEITGNDGQRLARLRELFGMITLNPGDRVLDAGCGSGVLFNLVEEKIGPEGTLVALDFSPEMIRRAGDLHSGHKNIRYMISSLEGADLEEGYFDAALCFGIIPHLEDIARGFSVLRNALKSTGRLYVFHLDSTDDLNRFHCGLDAPVKHDVLPGEKAIRQMLSDSGFTVNTYIDRPGLNFIEIFPC